jgi:hypothetical protein
LLPLNYWKQQKVPKMGWLQKFISILSIRNQICVFYWCWLFRWDLFQIRSFGWSWNIVNVSTRYPFGKNPWDATRQTKAMWMWKEKTLEGPLLEY